MRILLDTQCWLWMAASPDRFSPRARALVETFDHELFLSSASAWEIAIKHALGKLQLPEPPTRYVPSRVERLKTTPLSIEHDHALRVAALPPLQRDPFDRMLVAQAQAENLSILTADPMIGRYNVDVIPA
jgi:PIN domain nuclease of toxin-antitoxin system